MEHEKHNDRLEEIFAQKLDQASAEPNLWSTPNEDIWLGVNSELRKKRRDRRLLILFLFLFGVMLVFFLFGNEFLEQFWKKEAVEVPIASTNTSTSSGAAIDVIADDSRIEKESENITESENASIQNESFSNKDLPPSIPTQTVFKHIEKNSNSLAVVSDLEIEEVDNELVVNHESRDTESDITINSDNIEEQESKRSLVTSFEALESESIILLEEKDYTADFEEKI